MVFLPYIFTGLTVCSLAYYALCIVAARNFLTSAAKADSTSAPDAGLKAGSPTPVSILKPLKGCDPEMYESLRSHCMQEYPEFEIIFGVNDASDEAIPLIARLNNEFPNIAMRTAVSSQVLGANRKVSNLVQMLREAKYEHVLINDGDIRVPPGYLRDVMAEFQSDNDEDAVGLVTCLYRGIAGKTIWSKLEAMGINVNFMAGVLTAKLLERDVRFALGSTMATTKEAVAAIGGLETLVDYLADDYEQGKRIAAAGYRVEVSRVIVETFLPDYNFRNFLDHQLRWGRTVRSSRPGGYFGMVVTFGVLWALLGFAVDGDFAAAWMLAAVVAGKVLVAFVVGDGVIGDRNTIKRLWLLPVLELVTPAVWLISLFGDKIVWRGEVFTLRNGKLHH